MVEHVSIGQKFKIRGQRYILAQVDAGIVTLIHLKNGNRFRDPQKVACPQRLTAQEWYLISGMDVFSLNEMLNDRHPQVQIIRSRREKVAL
jgi:hypothetical protein